MNTLELLSPICDCLVPVCDSLLPNNPPAGELVLDQVLNNPSALPNNPTALNTELLNAAPDLNNDLDPNFNPDYYATSGLNDNTILKNSTTLNDSTIMTKNYIYLTDKVELKDYTASPNNTVLNNNSKPRPALAETSHEQLNPIQEMSEYNSSGSPKQPESKNSSAEPLIQINLSPVTHIPLIQINLSPVTHVNKL